MLSAKKPFFLALFFLLFLSSCTGEDEEVITFSVGGAPAELIFWEELIGEFQGETGIRVDLLRQPTATDQRRQGLVIPLASRKSDPDVFLMDVIWIPQFAASAWIETLDGYVQANRTNIEVFFPSVLETADRYHGELVALPVYVDGGLLYYRDDLLRQAGISSPPETWDQLVENSLTVQEAMRKTNPGFFGFVWQGAQYEGLICNFLEFAASNGGGIHWSEDKIILNTPENQKALKLMHDLIHRLRISPLSTYTTMREEEVRIAFQQGDALFERNWPYAWLLHQSAGSKVRGRTGIAPLPHFPSGSSVSTLGGWHIGISRYSDVKSLSWKLVEFVVSYDTQKRLAMELGWNPGRTDVYEDPVVIERLPHFPRLRQVFENALPRPTVPYYAQLSEVIQIHINAALAGSLTPEAALSLAQRDAQSLVDRYKEE